MQQIYYINSTSIIGKYQQTQGMELSAGPKITGPIP